MARGELTEDGTDVWPIVYILAGLVMMVVGGC